MLLHEETPPPNIQEIWLPFGMRKKKKYLPHIKLHNRDGVPYQGLQNIWKDYFSHVKIKQVI